MCSFPIKLQNMEERERRRRGQKAVEQLVTSEGDRSVVLVEGAVREIVLHLIR